MRYLAIRWNLLNWHVSNWGCKYQEKVIFQISFSYLWSGAICDQWRLPNKNWTFQTWDTLQEKQISYSSNPLWYDWGIKSISMFRKFCLYQKFKLPIYPPSLLILSHITLMLDAGELPGWVQKMMGHESLKMIRNGIIPISRTISGMMALRLWMMSIIRV